MKKRTKTDEPMVNSPHKDDFEMASLQYEDAGYVLIHFELTADLYHWKAVHLNHTLEANMDFSCRGRTFLRCHLTLKKCF